MTTDKPAAPQSAAPTSDFTVLRIKFENDKGETVRSPLEVRFPREMSKRIAAMYFLEAISKKMKASAEDMLKGLGF
jgi:hypothetical protein